LHLTTSNVNQSVKFLVELIEILSRNTLNNSFFGVGSKCVADWGCMHPVSSSGPCCRVKGRAAEDEPSTERSLIYQEDEPQSFEITPFFCSLETLGLITNEQ
jgi:hypothetical protein